MNLIGTFQKDVGEVAEMLYQFRHPLVISHNKFDDRFQLAMIPQGEALERTLAWYRSNPLTKG